jgi:hypothetical protein
MVFCLVTVITQEKKGCRTEALGIEAVCFLGGLYPPKKT